MLYIAIPSLNNPNKINSVVMYILYLFLSVNKSAKIMQNSKKVFKAYTP